MLVPLVSPTDFHHPYSHEPVGPFCGSAYLIGLFTLQVICILGETLEPFDDDGKIPVYGFGDSVTKDKDVFPIKPEASIVLI